MGVVLNAYVDVLEGFVMLPEAILVAILFIFLGVCLNEVKFHDD